MDSCPRNGFPLPTVSRRVYVDATSPDRSDRLDALTAEGFALLAQAQGERDRLEKERQRAERDAAEAEELALMEAFAEKEKLESDPPEEWNVERLKDFLREKGDRLSGNQILRRVRPESPACSMAWRCRFLTARRGQRGRVIAEK